jgi:hypothetical protein
VQRGIKQNKTMTVTSENEVLVQVSLLDEVKEIRTRLVNAIIEERFEVIAADREKVDINIEGVEFKYFYNPDTFLQGYIMGFLQWRVEGVEMDLIEHALRNHIPRLTPCECCGQNCTKS